MNILLVSFLVLLCLYFHIYKMEIMIGMLLIGVRIVPDTPSPALNLAAIISLLVVSLLQVDFLKQTHGCFISMYDKIHYNKKKKKQLFCCHLPGVWEKEENACGQIISLFFFLTILRLLILLSSFACHFSSWAIIYVCDKISFSKLLHFILKS